eukprot:COSAG03_NODE_3126_length_2196_cov_1.151168_3_plen_78_part_01
MFASSSLLCFGLLGFFSAAVLSWLTFGEAFSAAGTVCPSAYSKEGRCPVVEWEEQGGFGWGWSYMYRRDWATNRLNSG